MAPNIGTENNLNSANLLPKGIHQEDLEQFDKTLPLLVKDVVEHPEHRDLPKINLWIAKALEYNVLNGKMFRGFSTVSAFKAFALKHESNLEKAYILGWCNEIIESALLINSNLINDVPQHRGKEAWHLQEDLGPLAFNDAVTLSGVNYYLLKKYFEKESFYIPLLNTFHNAQMYRALGDRLFSKEKIRENFNFLNLNRYEAIVKYNTSYFSFYTPVAVGMYLAGVEDPKWFEEVENLFLKIGLVYEMNRDYKFLFKEVPKCEDIVNSDGPSADLNVIASGSLSWFLFAALQKGTRQQKLIIKNGFSTKDSSLAKKIADIYEQLGLAQECIEESKNLRNEIEIMISNLSPGMPKEFFKDMVDYVMNL